MTKTYEITNAKSGLVLARYYAETEAAALEALARDAGYETYAEACEVAPADTGEIVVTEIMPLHEIYENYQPGSTGFQIAVETHCGFEISRTEIEAIARKAKTADEFQRIWEYESWWLDA